MDRILPARTRWPLHQAAVSRQIEADAAAAAARAGEPRLMVRAGIAVARLASALAPFASRIWIVAGPGNNGGDGIEAALHLHRQGRQVTLNLLGDAGKLPRDAAVSLQAATEAGVIAKPLASPPRLDANDLVIDALLGLGSSRAPEGPIAAAIDRINAQRCAILAVDLPTGLDGDRGALLGDCAVRASATLALLTLKPGLFTGAGREFAGSIWFDALGAQPATHQPDAWLSGPNRPHGGARMRRHDQHKGSFGDLAVVAGAPGMSGAALLCARAAHAAGAGRVWIVPLDDAAPLLDPARPELMWVRDLDVFDPDRLGRMTIAAGCGGGEAIAQQLPRLLRHAARLVIDADGLNAIAGDPALAKALRERSDRGQPSILTPHPLEAARLLGTSSREVQHDRLQAAQRLADRFGAVAVLKGSGSVIAAPAMTPQLNSSGGPALATPGSGDVLAGWLAGIWSAAAASTAAKGSTSAAETAFLAASDAVWWHGTAADRSTLPLLRAADLIEAMAAAPTAG
ncbi:NAD(P)H-hydrate dehydratase [Piscinibacter sakaiensis]|uniref:NAD(P)H-hydrate dehydratase n=1 Tax=Piscinibacter sakaiensis TaxID=1547922 RepID=UPI003AAE08ED